MLVKGIYIQDNYVKLDNYKGQPNFLIHIKETYNIGDRLELEVNDYEVLEVVLVNKPKPEIEFEEE